MTRHLLAGHTNNYIPNKDEVDQNQIYEQPPAPPPAGRPQVYILNGRPAPPPQVRDDVHIPKLKLNIPPFEGRYVPNIYLTWELETEQCLTCLQYPEERRVPAAVCAFTSLHVFCGLNTTDYILF